MKVDTIKLLEENIAEHFVTQITVTSFSIH